MNGKPLLLAGAALLLAACDHMGAPDNPVATATLAPTAGNDVSGTVYFAQRGDRMLVSGEVRGLAPDSEHGFHVHENGDCSSGDGMSAGGHFNPGKQPHGRYDTSPHHAGDLPSLHADASGVASVNFESRALRVGRSPIELASEPSAPNVVGRALIVHRDPDDFTSQPAGNSGPRLACAVIRRS